MTQANPTETEEAYLRFWKKFDNFLKNKNSKFFINTPKPKYNNEIPMIRGCVYRGLVISKGTGKKRIEIYLGKEKHNTDFFKELQSQEQAINKALGFDIVFDGSLLPRNQHSRIVYKQPFNFMDETSWNDECEWFEEMIIEFDKVFTPRVKTIAKKLGITP